MGRKYFLSLFAFTFALSSSGFSEEGSCCSVKQADNKSEIQQKESCCSSEKETYKLAMKWSKDLKKNYQISINFSEVNGFKIPSINMPMNLHVTDIDDKGVATIRCDMEVGVAKRLLANGTGPTDPADRKVMILKMDSNGKVLESTKSPLFGSADGFIATSFPKEPISVGDSWTIDRDLNKDGKITNKYTLKSVNHINGRKIADVLVDFSGITNNTSVSGTGSILLDIENGFPVKVNMKANSPIPGAASKGKIVMDMAMEEVSNSQDANKK